MSCTLTDIRPSNCNTFACEFPNQLVAHVATHRANAPCNATCAPCGFGPSRAQVLQFAGRTPLSVQHMHCDFWCHNAAYPIPRATARGIGTSQTPSSAILQFNVCSLCEMRRVRYGLICLRLSFDQALVSKNREWKSNVSFGQSFLCFNRYLIALRLATHAPARPQSPGVRSINQFSQCKNASINTLINHSTSIK